MNRRTFLKSLTLIVGGALLPKVSVASSKEKIAEDTSAWHHVVTVFTSPTSRSVYLDGVCIDDLDVAEGK